MYYRYKTKKKKGKFVKYFIYLLIIAGLVTAAYRNRQHLLFWKYTQNRLAESIDSGIAIKDTARRREELKALVKVMEQYKNDNAVNPDAFFMSGKVEFNLAETYLPGGFSEIVISETPLSSIDKGAREGYIRAMKDIKKGEALLDGSEIKPDAAFQLAMASWYVQYNSGPELMEMVKNVDIRGIAEPEFIRFFALLNILNGKSEQGLTLIMDNDRPGEGIDGRLFLAVAQRMARQYTHAIINFKDLLNKTSDSGRLKIINYNLGLIYFSQSLHKESLEHFENCMKIDGSDNRFKVWAGKNLAATGKMDKAKLLWKEVLASDPTHEEAKKLLGAR